MIDPDTYRSVLGRFASGVTVITARDESGRDYGMTVSAFCALSLEPPLVLACINHDASMYGLLQTTERFAVNILSARQEAIARRFADPERDRFDGLGYARSDGGLLMLEDAIAHMECEVRERNEAGDHTIFIASVMDARMHEGQPLLYYRGGYAELVR